MGDPVESEFALVVSDPSHELAWLCGTAVRATGVTSCGVTMTTRGGQNLTAYASDEQARAVENLQHTLGEGPGVAASESGAAVLVPDLQDPRDGNLDRWPTFAQESSTTGIRAAFAFPLMLGTSSIGAFSLYRREAGGLTSEGVSRGWGTAEAVALSLADPSELADPSGLDDPRDPGSPERDRNEHSDLMRVHQAAGMVMVQLGLPIDQALLRMRATAYAEGQSVDELADAIVDRRRRLSEEET
jgi:hypothetical protein